MKRILKSLLNFSFLSLYRKWQFGKLQRKAEKIIKDYLSHTDSKKLHIGSGGHVMDGWLNIDIEPQSPEVAFMDAGDKFPLPANSFEFIFSEHVFEHLTLAQQKNMLKESMRVLKPGGCIRIATPDFDFLMNLAAVQKSDLQQRYLAWNLKIFLPSVSGQTACPEVYVINNYFRDWGHQLIHNKLSLRELLAASGFANISNEAVGSSSHPELRQLEAHGAMITDEFNQLETMVMEATKPR